MQNDFPKSPETELRLAILQVLLRARKKRPVNGGATGKQLIETLGLDSVDSLREALIFLTDKNLVAPGDRNFQITADGVDYLEENPPSSDSPGSPPPPPPSPPPSPPWTPGDPPGSWPPKNDPDDPSRVPRRRKPSDSAGAIALPLPEAKSEQS